jgi:hypothetical protein
MTILKSMTFSKQCKKEIAALLPTAKRFSKVHVAGIGYVFYIKNAEGITIGKAFREPMVGMVLA